MKPVFSQVMLKCYLLNIITIPDGKAQVISQLYFSYKWRNDTFNVILYLLLKACLMNMETARYSLY
jgi:hypothetical protein